MGLNPIRQSSKNIIEHPFIIIRLMSAAYCKKQVIFEKNGRPTADKFIFDITSPFDENGRLTKTSKTIVINAAVALVKATNHQVCIVWNQTSCTYCELDGSQRPSKIPPSGGTEINSIQSANHQLH